MEKSYSFPTQSFDILREISQTLPLIRTICSACPTIKEFVNMACAYFRVAFVVQYGNNWLLFDTRS